LLPPATESGPDVLEEIRRLAADRTLIVLDDDPTGTQTVRDLDVLTQWSAQEVRRQIESSDEPFFVLTNSRGLSASAAADLAHRLGAAIAAAEVVNGRRTSVVSRSDSTLRGHFPIEVDALADGLGRSGSRVILAPFFGDGGRVTVDDVHYLRRGDGLLPVGRSEFAADPTFGFRASNLRHWVVEKGARDRALTSVSLEDLRRGPAAVVDALANLPARGILIANAETERDIDIVALGALEAEARGIPVIARTAASYVRARAGQAPHELLAPSALGGGGPGIVVAGSHVPTTTEQLADLLSRSSATDLELIELDAALIERGGRASRRQERVATEAIDRTIGRGAIPVLATSRTLVRAGRSRSDIEVGSAISAALVRTIQAMSARPSWVVAKGGITSSDIATRALAVRRATVLGQIIGGVSIWRLGAESRWPGITYAVFPGNVGPADGLRQVVTKLAGK
jgi:uncharacterized protein YgbK (DUF1537 family)